MWSNKVSWQFWCFLCQANESSDDFEVSIFLTEIQTRHALLVKNKTFRKKASYERNDGVKTTSTVTIRDEDEEDGINLADIPAADDTDGDAMEPRPERAPTFDEQDDKKKLGFNTTYEGFNIWGRVLCLFIERKGGPGKKASGVPGKSQALMQDWIQSTQEQKDDDL